MSTAGYLFSCYRGGLCPPERGGRAPGAQRCDPGLWGGGAGMHYLEVFRGQGCGDAFHPAHSTLTGSASHLGEGAFKAASYQRLRHFDPTLGLGWEPGMFQ